LAMELGPVGVRVNAICPGAVEGDRMDRVVAMEASCRRSTASPASLAVPPAFDGFVEHSKRVSPTCLISFERNRYSVPASFANRPVSLRVYPDKLVVAAEGQILCEHARVIQRSHHLPPQTIYDWR
ncbi:hypothetical protein OO012_20000, partial [Rhodobacteraceae bacterium KMM 6894]|nr:hypothetical protein [Rhodobacteraceae bacterium KMM 6894]